MAAAQTEGDPTPAWNMSPASEEESKPQGRGKRLGFGML